jgi:hypothetical protein
MARWTMAQLCSKVQVGMPAGFAGLNSLDCRSIVAKLIATAL